MALENGEWIMHGLDWDDPDRIKTPDELIAYIDKVGFLPLFANGIKGFSAEEHVSDLYWWSGIEEEDPWEWRAIIARSRKVAYGKFFGRKAGFISWDWFPAFANYRRDGYDFDALWDDELAGRREKKVMDIFLEHDELFSFEIKEKCGFGSGGEKNFEGTISELQMQGYLVVKDLRRRKRKKDGREYGWAISVYTPPEKLVGYDAVAKGYAEEPEASFERIVRQIYKSFPGNDENAIRKFMKK